MTTKAVQWALVLLLLSTEAALSDGYQDFNAGVAAANRDNYDAATRYLTKAIGEADLPKHLVPTAFWVRGLEYEEQKKVDAALSDYSQAIELNPTEPQFYVFRCTAYTEKELFDKAIADCTYAIQLQPHNWRLREARNLIYKRLNHLDAIIDDYTLFISERKDDVALLLGRADTYQLAGQFDKALADAEAARDLVPKEAYPYSHLGWINAAQGKFADALDNADDVVDRSPKGATAYLTKGFYQWALGRFDDAAGTLEQSLDRYKLQGYAFLWLFISEAAQHKDVPADYVEPFRSTSLQEWPGPLVSLYLGKSQPDSLLKLKGRDPDGDGDIQCEASFFVGEWFRKQGDEARGKQLIQAAFDACDPNTVARALAAAELKRLP